MKLASRASRPGLTVGSRVSPTLPHYNECLCCTICSPVFGQATELPRRSHLLHDLITQEFLRSLQYGIVVMGFIGAFVYAHHQHCRSIDNPGNFGDCMKGRFCFMAAITSANAHAFQATCRTRHMPAVPRLNFRLPKPTASYPHLPNVRTTTRERGNDFQEWTIYTDGGTRVVDGETFAGWSAVARPPDGRIMFGLVITTEARLAFSGARTRSNNTADDGYDRSIVFARAPWPGCP